MVRLIAELLRPYRWSLGAVLATMLVQTAMSLAAPWPLKVILDNVVGNHRPPQWINWLLPMLGGDSKGQIAAAAGIVTVSSPVFVRIERTNHRPFFLISDNPTRPP